MASPTTRAPRLDNRAALWNARDGDNVRVRLSGDRNGPAWDLPPSPAGMRTYVLASTPRTGSTLLANAVWDTRRAGAPKEYLNPMQIRDFAVRLGTRSARLRHACLFGPLVGLAGITFGGGEIRAHLARVIALRTGPSGWFGLKLHHHHFERWWPEVETMLGAVRWIHVSRRDRTAQAVSWDKALQTGRWASFQRAWRPPIYSRRRIGERLAAIDRAEAGWETFFGARCIAPLRLLYEDFATDLGPSVAAILRHLDLPDDVAPPRPSIARQSDATNERWIARFAAWQSSTLAKPCEPAVGPTPSTPERMESRACR